MKKLLSCIRAAAALICTAPATYARSVQLEHPGKTATAEPETPPEEPEMVCLGEYRVTGYDPYCTHCCARADGITASGVIVTEGYTVAMCRDFPFGTKVYIE